MHPPREIAGTPRQRLGQRPKPSPGFVVVVTIAVTTSSSGMETIDTIGWQGFSGQRQIVTDPVDHKDRMSTKADRSTLHRISSGAATSASSTDSRCRHHPAVACNLSVAAPLGTRVSIAPATISRCLHLLLLPTGMKWSICLQVLEAWTWLRNGWGLGP